MGRVLKPGPRENEAGSTNKEVKLEIDVTVDCRVY